MGINGSFAASSGLANGIRLITITLKKRIFGGLPFTKSPLLWSVRNWSFRDFNSSTTKLHNCQIHRRMNTLFQNGVQFDSSKHNELPLRDCRGEFGRDRHDQLNACGFRRQLSIVAIEFGFDMDQRPAAVDHASFDPHRALSDLGGLKSIQPGYACDTE